MTTTLPTPDSLIGNTPLIRLSRFGGTLPVEVCVKMESHNLTGSDKDRIAWAVLNSAEADGSLVPGGTLIAATSGNLAVSLAALGVPRGYRVILVMPEGMPQGRVRLLRALGAEVFQTPVPYGMKGANARADALSRELPQCFRIDPFDSRAAVEAHHATADEIWRATEGELSAVVVPVATAATVSGVGQRLRALSDRVQIIAVQPASSPLLSGGAAGPHRLLGMGAPFRPANFDDSVVDEIVNVTDNECHDSLIRLYRTEGLAAGPAGGAALAATMRISQRDDFKDTRIVAILPDSMDRYNELRFWDTFTFVMPAEPNE